MKDWIHEDQLPVDLSNDDYDDWSARSRVIDGVRMGPRPVRLSGLRESPLSRIPPNNRESGKESDNVRYF